VLPEDAPADCFETAGEGAPRIAKELREPLALLRLFHSKTPCQPEGISLIQTDDLQCWTLGIEGLGIYEGERFALQFKFSDSYPIGASSVAVDVVLKSCRISPSHLCQRKRLCATGAPALL
jgi:ubiquitin-protein ligase